MSGLLLNVRSGLGCCGLLVALVTLVWEGVSFFSFLSFQLDG